MHFSFPVLSLADPDPVAFWQWILSAAAVLHIIKTVQGMIATNKQMKAADKPANIMQPFTVRKHEDNVNASDFNAFREEVRAQFVQVQRNGENRVAAITEGFDADIRRVEDKQDERDEKMREFISEELHAVFNRLNQQGEHIAALRATQKIPTRSPSQH